MKRFTICFPVADSNLLYKFTCAPVNGKYFKNGKLFTFTIIIKDTYPNTNFSNNYKHPFFAVINSITHVTNQNVSNSVEGKCIWNKFSNFLVSTLKLSDKKIEKIRPRFFACDIRGDVINTLWNYANLDLIENKRAKDFTFRACPLKNFEDISLYEIPYSQTLLYNVTHTLTNGTGYKFECHKLNYGNFLHYNMLTSTPCLQRLEHETSPVRVNYLHPLFDRDVFSHPDIYDSSDYYQRTNVVCDTPASRLLVGLLALNDKDLCNTLHISLQNDILTSLKTSFLPIISNLILEYITDIEEISYHRTVIYMLLSNLWD